MSLQTDASGFQPSQEKKRSLLSPSDKIPHDDEQVTSIQRGEDKEKFVERKELLQSPLEYTRNGSNPGLVLIFNQQKFKDPISKYRLGSRRDVNEIVTCMSRLGFNINEDHIYTDCRRNKIIKIIQDIVRQDLSQASDISLQTSDLWKEFAQCEQLKDKPKMFIFQACKGENKSTISSDCQEEKIELVPHCTFSSDYIGPDMLIVYSTTEGNASFRDEILGTWFIQELCKTFSAYGRRDDVLSLIIRTTKCICRNYYCHEETAIKKQMPIFVSTLRKKFYLTRSKDRNILFKLLDNQEKMQRNIQEVAAKVEELILEKEKKK